MTAPFWKRKFLEDMTPTEWESLCDQCGLCCLNKLQDEDTLEVVYTCVACRLFDDETGRCSNYSHRFEYVPDCIQITPEIARTCTWLPSTCAYRRIAEGKDLPPWHHLITGSYDDVHREGIGARHRTFSETDIELDDLEHYLIDWVSTKSDES